MCNIAGYVGEKDAAPILIEMMKKQEGLAGGYYTGIATICDGKLYYAKLTGDTDRLVSFTEASKLPGKIGIIHSRSIAGGSDEWAHPFVGMKKGIPMSAYVANGIPGKFDKSNHNAVVQRLIDDGYDMNAHLTDVEKGRYMDLSDGTSVHMSDVMCQLIFCNEEKCGNPVEAMTNAFCEIPAEIVGLYISLCASDRIFWSRINRPMMAGFSDHGAYLATSAIAFPDDASEPFALPACASGYITSGEVNITAYPKPPVCVEPMNLSLRSRAYEKICAKLKTGFFNFKELKNEIMPLFGEGGCYQDALMTYEVLYALYKQSKLCVDKRIVPGAADGIDAPKFYLNCEL